jgi:hypothetical protein
MPILAVSSTNMCSYYHYCIIYFILPTRSFSILFFFALPNVIVIRLHSSVFLLYVLYHSRTHAHTRRLKRIVMLSFAVLTLTMPIFFSYFSCSLNIRIRTGKMEVRVCDDIDLHLRLERARFTINPLKWNNQTIVSFFL